MLWYGEGYDLTMSYGHVEHAILPSTWASLTLVHLMHRTLTIQHSHPLSHMQELWIHVPRLFLHYQQHLPSLCLTNSEVCRAQTDNPGCFACIFLLGPTVALGSELHIHQSDLSIEIMWQIPLWQALQWSTALWASVIISWCVYTLSTLAITAPTLLRKDAMLRTERCDKLVCSQGYLIPISCTCSLYA